jgi:hypothetical protein
MARELSLRFRAISALPPSLFDCPIAEFAITNRIGSILVADSRSEGGGTLVLAAPVYLGLENHCPGVYDANTSQGDVSDRGPSAESGLVQSAHFEGTHICAPGSP